MSSEILKPTKTEILVYMTLSTLGLAIVNLLPLANSLVDSTSVNLGFGIFSRKITEGLSLIDNFEFSGPLAQGVFWALVGCIIYIVVFSAQEIASETRQELKESVGDLHRPAYSKRSALLQHTLERILIRLAALGSIIILSFLTIGFLVPISIQLVRDFSYLRSRPIFILNPFIGVLLMSACLHGFVVGTRLMMLKTRLSSDEAPPSED